MNALLELCITSSVLILCLLVVRRLTRGHIPPRVMYTLWLIAALRLMLPFSLIQSSVSVMNAVEYARTEVVFAPTNVTEITADAPESNISEVTPPQTSAVIDAAPVKKVNFKTVVIITWIAGSVTCAVWIAAINIKLALTLKANREKVDCAGSDLPVWTVAGLPSPCLFRLGIYMPPEIACDTDKIRYVIAHEYAHYRSFDPIWTALRNILLVAYWWNPLVWAAAYASREDGELACDESAIKALGEDERFHYGRALVGLIARNKIGSIVSAATTMTGSSKRIKERVGLIAKKPRLFVPAFILILTVIVVAVGCTFTGAGKKADVYERYGLSIPFPDSYLGKVTATPEDELGDNVLLELYQNATHENYPDMGWLFSITRCTEDNIIPDEYNAGSTEYFATDGNWYYAIMRPTSVEVDMNDENIMAEYALFQDQIEKVKIDFIAANKLESFSSHDWKAIDFKDYDFQGITSAVVIDGQTGESVTLHNKDDIDSITSYFKTISGNSPISSRGYYGFYYSVVLYNSNNKSFEIVFLPGNTETGYAFNYGLCETVGEFDYEFRYVLSSDMNGDFIDLLGSYFPTTETGDVPADISNYSIIFEEDKTFSVELSLPNRYTMKKSETPVTDAVIDTVSFGGSRSVLEILQDGERIGYLTYNEYNLYPDVPKDRFAHMVYSDIMNSNMADWDSGYTPVAINGTTHAATDRVQWSIPVAGGGSRTEFETTNVLAYDDEVFVYVLIVFDSGIEISDADLTAIAQSLQIKAKTVMRRQVYDYMASEYDRVFKKYYGIYYYDMSGYTENVTTDIVEEEFMFTMIYEASDGSGMTEINTYYKAIRNETDGVFTLYMNSDPDTSQWNEKTVDDLILGR